MTRQILIVIGSALLAVGGSGIIVALSWLTTNKVRGTLPGIYDTHAEILLFLLPAIFLAIAILGAVFLSSAFSLSPKDTRRVRNLHPHSLLHM